MFKTQASLTRETHESRFSYDEIDWKNSSFRNYRICFCCGYVLRIVSISNWKPGWGVIEKNTNTLRPLKRFDKTEVWRHPNIRTAACYPNTRAEQIVGRREEVNWPENGIQTWGTDKNWRVVEAEEGQVRSDGGLIIGDRDYRTGLDTKTSSLDVRSEPRRGPWHSISKGID